MRKVIPRKTKVKIQFGKFDIADIILGIVGIGVAIALFLSNFGNGINYIVGLAWVAIVVAMFFEIADDLRLYKTLGYLFRFAALKKKYTKEKTKKDRGYSKVDEIIPFTKIVEDRFISFGDEYYAQVFEVQPIEFGLLNDYKQEMVVSTFANVIRRVATNQVW